MSEFEQFPYEMEQQRVVPANEPGRGVCLTGMILGISACVFALFTFMMIIIFGIAADSGSTYYYRTMIMSITPMNIMLSMVSLGLSIPATDACITMAVFQTPCVAITYSIWTDEDRVLQVRDARKNDR